MNNPMSEQERKLDAAEYVIGTLSSVERVAFEASIDSDASTKADVHFWERVFGSLNASVAPEAPDEKVWERIEKELQEMASKQSGDAAAGTEEAKQQLAKEYEAKLEALGGGLSSQLNRDAEKTQATPK